MNAPLRLTPEMVSRKLQVLAAVKRYWATHGASPSFAEIGADVGISRQEAWRYCRTLADERELVLVAGHRGIGLPDPIGRVTLADAILRLRAEGFVVDEDVFKARSD